MTLRADLTHLTDMVYKLRADVADQQQHHSTALFNSLTELLTGVERLEERAADSEPQATAVDNAANEARQNDLHTAIVNVAKEVAALSKRVDSLETGRVNVVRRLEALEEEMDEPVLQHDHYVSGNGATRTGPARWGAAAEAERPAAEAERPMRYSVTQEDKDLVDRVRAARTKTNVAGLQNVIIDDHVFASAAALLNYLQGE